MAQTVETIIEIDSIKIKQFSSLKLSQELNAHHTFRLVCPVEAFAQNADNIFTASKSLIGAPLVIHVTSVQERSNLLFSGLVTQVEVASNNGHPGSFIISGFSPTILLDSGPHCKSWIRKSVKSIIKDVLKSVPSPLFSSRIDPVHKETLSYKVQYKETPWQFINRLANRYGEWLFYDGQQLVLGPPRGKPISLTYGVQLSRFAMSMQIKPNVVRAKAYDYVKDEVYESQVENIAGMAGHKELGEYAVEKSTQVYRMDTNYWCDHFVSNKRQVDEFTNTRAVMQSSDLIRMHGSSDLPGFQPGDTVSVKDYQFQSAGDYIIISIEHSWDGIGNYANEFVAIPASVKMPPRLDIKEPYCEVQSAEVIKNHDEAGLGRVQVRFRWMSNTEKSLMLQVVTTYAGEGKGIFFLPEVGEKVLVAFSGGDPTQPYVIGTVRHGKAKIGYGNEDNDIKAIHTRSGATIIMNDKDGSISLEDKGKGIVKFDGEGNIKMEAIEKLELVCGEGKFVLNKDGTVAIDGRTMKINATEELRLGSNGQAEINADAKVAVKSPKIALN